MNAKDLHVKVVQLLKRDSNYYATVNRKAAAPTEREMKEWRKGGRKKARNRDGK